MLNGDVVSTPKVFFFKK